MAELMDLLSHLGDSLQQLFGLLTMAGSRFTNNLGESFSSVSLKQWIRLVTVVGAYLLIRPYVLKHATTRQQAQLEKEHEADEAARAEIQPNHLRGQIDIPEDSDDEEVAEGAATATNWGGKARKRQRQFVKKLLDAEEQRLADLQEDEEDKDIEQYLVG
ncbi:protein trafficking Pga2 [Pseudomassariella vexata]|uniref:Protein trafficking Pga2 n=1 Tax=Pseudomassariella vexata TaxID=1141098 RepID=A0A1Y2EIV2_9PEZI|nr:protein trafficking Pga2 [Pseudomassariella vexata]ORY71244.1 protein trafficking Pga2 [Pseudomassariella vexata]